MKRIIALLLIAIMCFALVSCDSADKMSDIEKAIDKLPKDSYAVKTALRAPFPSGSVEYTPTPSERAAGWESETGIDFKGGITKEYYIYEAVMQDGKLTILDELNAALFACEIIVLEFEFVEDAELFAKQLQDLISKANAESKVFPDWIFKTSENVVVMAQGQKNMDLVW